MEQTNPHLFRGLQALGELLASRGQSYAFVVGGGASLAALGVLERVTTDVDVMAIRDASGKITVAPKEFPDFVATAVLEVGRELNMPSDWLNTEMASGLRAGFPPSFDTHLTWRQFGALHVGFAGRLTLIALKLEAASDDPSSQDAQRHLADLVALGSTPDELDEAAKWVLDVNVDPRRTTTINQVKQNVAERRTR
jgi:hypothetical protein